MKTTSVLCLVTTCWLMPVLLQAEEKPAPVPTPATETLPKIAATDKAAITAAKGKRVTVTGDLTETNEAKGLTFLNFGKRDFTVVVMEPDYPAFKAGKPAALYRNKKVEVTGEIVDYKGKLEIKATSPDQIKVIGEVAAPTKPATEGGKPATDGKKTGK